MSIFSDYSSSSEMHNNLTIDYYLALSSTKGSGITNIISIILQQAGYDSNLLIVFYVQIMPDDFVMQLHRF